MLISSLLSASLLVITVCICRGSEVSGNHQWSQALNLRAAGGPSTVASSSISMMETFSSVNDSVAFEEGDRGPQEAREARSAPSRKETPERQILPPLRGLKTLGVGIVLLSALLAVSLVREYDPVRRDVYDRHTQLAQLNRKLNHFLPPERRLNWVMAFSILSVIFVSAGLGELLASVLWRHRVKKGRGGPPRFPSIMSLILLFLGGILLYASTGMSGDIAVSPMRRRNTAVFVATAAGAMGLLQLVSSLLQQAAFRRRRAALDLQEQHHLADLSPPYNYTKEESRAFPLRDSLTPKAT